MIFSTGDRVRVSAAVGTVDAVIVESRSTEDLPDLPMIESSEARELLRAEFSRVAFVQYDWRGRAVMFVALQDGVTGCWFDLKGQKIEIALSEPAQTGLFGGADAYPD